MKTNKSLTKRFKKTKSGKIIYRIAGQNHFLSKQSGKTKRQKHKDHSLSKEMVHQLRKLVF